MRIVLGVGEQFESDAGAFLAELQIDLAGRAVAGEEGCDAEAGYDCPDDIRGDTHAQQDAIVRSDASGLALHVVGDAVGEDGSELIVILQAGDDLFGNEDQTADGADLSADFVVVDGVEAEVNLGGMVGSEYSEGMCAA